MASKGQTFRRHCVEFKEFIVRYRLSGKSSLKQICKIYKLNSENVIKWTRRLLRGEPLVMKRGRKPQKPQVTAEEQKTQKDLKAEVLRLTAELAFKDELLKLYQEKEEIKKKKSL